MGTEFSANTAGHKGVVYLAHSTFTFKCSVLIANNAASSRGDYGGAIIDSKSTITLIKSLFINNQNYDIYCSDSASRYTIDLYTTPPKHYSSSCKYGFIAPWSTKNVHCK